MPDPPSLPVARWLPGAPLDRGEYVAVEIYNPVTNRFECLRK
jgi:hypothetical protein